MNKQELLIKISNCINKSQLDDMRKEIVEFLENKDEETFYEIQKAFIRKKNSLKRLGGASWYD